jgi:HEAT repeat protein
MDMTGTQPEITALIQSLTDPNKKVVRQTADALITRAQEEPELARRLETLLSAAPPERCWPIAFVLGHIGSPSLRCLQILQETLDSRDPDLRWAAGSLLARLGKEDRRVPELMLALLKTGTSTQRRMAVYVLRDLKVKNDAVLSALLAALDDTDPLVRVAAVLSLELQTEIHQAGLDSLLDLFLRDPDTRVRCAGAFALATLGTRSEKISAALTTAVYSGDPRLRKAAEAALETLKKKARHRPCSKDDGGPR